MALQAAGAARSAQARATHNVAQPERIASVTVGAALITYGLKRRGGASILIALVGAVFIPCGATGDCPTYSSPGVAPDVLGQEGRLHESRDPSVALRHRRHARDSRACREPLAKESRRRNLKT